MSQNLHAEEIDLLTEVLSKHNPSLLKLLSKLGNTVLTVDEREDIREAISDEFIETGLKPDDEPNDRGLLLEDLIDRLGHL